MPSFIGAARFAMLSSPCLPKHFLSSPKYGPFGLVNKIKFEDKVLDWPGTCAFLFGFSLWCHTSIVQFFAVFRCTLYVGHFAKVRLAIAKFRTDEFSPPRTFVNGLVLTCEISRPFR